MAPADDTGSIASWLNHVARPDPARVKRLIRQYPKPIDREL
jgi:hypothetical protein